MLAGDARRFVFQAPGQDCWISRSAFVGVVEFPGLAQRLADRGMQRLGQTLDDVAGLVNLTALDRRMAAEGPPDRLGQRLGAVDDEQAAEPPGRGRAPPDCPTAPAPWRRSRSLLRSRRAGASTPSPSTPTAASRINSSPMCMPSIWIASRSSRERSDGHPLGHPLRRQRHETARHRRLRAAVAFANAGTSPLGQAARPGRTYASTR